MKVNGGEVLAMHNWLCQFTAIALAMVGSVPILAEQGSSITIKVLYDNYTAEKGLKADWGFSCLITGTEKSILFDTGAKGDVLLQNMAKMNVSPGAAEVAVISHNHGDHTGGLPSVLEKNGKLSVYLPPSCPKTLVQHVESLGAKVVTVTKPVEICKGVYVIGPTGDKIVEQALAVNTAKGLVIITGCSHPGVIEIAKRAKAQLNRGVYMVCGGMHLLEMSEVQVRDVARGLKHLGIQKIGPAHCTGEKAVGWFKDEFGDAYVQMGVGRVLQFEKAKTHTNPIGKNADQHGQSLCAPAWQTLGILAATKVTDADFRIHLDNVQLRRFRDAGPRLHRRGKEFLNEECAELCRKQATALVRKRP